MNKYKQRTLLVNYGSDLPPHLAWLKSQRLKLAQSQSPGPGSYELPSALSRLGASSDRADRFRQQNNSVITELTSPPSPKPNCHLGYIGGGTVRTFFQQLIYKTNNKELAELREQLNFKDWNPGPGSYNPKPPVKHQRVLKQLQTRFKNTKNQNPGPGRYAESLSNGHSFSFGQQVRSGRVKAASQVGPGNYYSQSKAKKQQGFFGSSVQRFSDDKTSGPGPGQYQVRIEKTPVITSSFMGTGRRQLINRQGHSFIKVDCYDIAKKIQKTKDQLAKLTQFKVQLPGFGSHSQRFS